MIERAWLESQEGLIVEYYDEKFLHCQLNSRGVDLLVNEFLDGTYSTSIHFLENGIVLFRAEVDGLQMDFAKELIAEWLINKVPHGRLVEHREGIVQDDIYDAYTKGEDAMINYHWQDVKERLQELVINLSQEKGNLIVALELCQKSSILKKIIPYISVGRFCLSRTTLSQPYSTDCLCLNYINNKFEVADYEHRSVQLFDNAVEAVQFMENFYEPPKESRYA